MQRLFLLFTLIVPPLATAQSGGLSVATLAAGDRITLRLPGESTLPERLEIDQRGVVTLPRVGPLTVTALDPAQLADSIRTLYSKLFVNRDVTVILLRRITVFGEVNKPGVLYLETSASIRDAIATAQGATPLAEVNHVNLIRGTVSERLENWSTLSAETKPLYSGDAIMMDRESWLRRNVGAIFGGLGILVSVVIALRR